MKKGNGFIWREWAAEPKLSVCRTFVGSVCGFSGSKAKICNRFSKPNSEPGPNATVSPKFLLAEVDGLSVTGKIAMLAQLQDWRRVAMQTTKQDVEHLLNQLPDDSTLEDIQYHLYVLDKVKRGQRDIADGKRYTSEEVRVRLSRWITP
jgi:predicted transcriptional regulator